MKIVWKWIILVLLATYVVAMAIWANAEAEKHACHGIAVSITGGGITDSITRRGVLDLLKRYPEKIVGVPSNRVNTLGVERYLMSFNNFEDVRCYISTKGLLTVEIQPMIPEIRVFDGDKSYYVNKDGKHITSNSEFFVDVPVVSGRFTKKFTPREVLPVVRFVERDSLLRNLVTMYVANDPDNIILVPRFSGHVINFGDTSHMPEKRRAILTAYRNILPYKGWDTYDTLSVKFRGQIVATRRDKKPLYPFEAIVEEIDPEEASLPTETAPGETPPENRPADNAPTAGNNTPAG